MPRVRSTWLLLASLLIAAWVCTLAPGCRKAGQPQPVAPAEFELERSASSGALRVRIVVSQASITVADRLGVLIEQELPAGSEPQWPDALGSIEGFGIAELAENTRIDPVSGRVTHVRRITLEPFLPGDRAVPAMTFHNAAAAAPVGFDAIPVRVESVLHGSDAAATELAAPLPPVGLGPSHLSRSIALYAGLGAAALLAAGVTGVVVMRRRRQPESDPLAIARAALVELRAGLTSDGVRPSAMPALSPTAAMDRLSLLVRRFLQQRIGLQAIEMTPAELAGSPTVASRLRREHQAMLSGLLARLDGARFAPGSTTDSTAALRAVDDASSLIEAIAAPPPSEAAA